MLMKQHNILVWQRLQTSEKNGSFMLRYNRNKNLKEGDGGLVQVFIAGS